MKRIIKSSEAIFAMSNVCGKQVKNPHTLPFSFYFSGNQGVKYGPRVKPVFNDSKLRVNMVGTLDLCNDWKFIPGEDDKHVSKKQIAEMRMFFKAYIVLFCAVWDLQIDDNKVQDYFRDLISFEDMVKSFDFYDKYSEQLDEIHDIRTLENFCREHDLVNFYGN